MDISKLIYYVVLLFIMMIPGFILKKCKLIGPDFGKGISNLVLYIAQPALVFLAYIREFNKEILINSLWVFLLSIMAHVIFTVVAMLLFRGAVESRRRMLRFATIFSNAAFMGIPLIDAVLGAEATLYASIYNITFNLFLWSLGVFLCTEHRDIDGDGECDGEEIRKKDGVSLTRALVHPVTIAAAAGLIMFVISANRFLTEGNIIYDSLAMLKALVAPLSMTVIGIRLADINLRGFFTDKYLYLFIALRHFLLPLAVIGIIRLLAIPFPALGGDVLMVTAILAATPAASSATMFAEKYDCDAAYVSKLVAASTILSLASMPLVMLVATI